jgi:hypothetical protein
MEKAKTNFACTSCKKERKGVVPFLKEGQKICPRCIQKNPDDYPEFWTICIDRSWSGIPDDPREPGHYTLWLREISRLEDRFFLDKNLSENDRAEILGRIDVLEKRVRDYRDHLELRSKQIHRAIWGVA